MNDNLKIILALGIFLIIFIIVASGVSRDGLTIFDIILTAKID